MFWGGTILTSGWVTRAVSSHILGNLGLYIAQIVLILGGPPVYAASEYNNLGRLRHYLPTHPSLHPSRVFFFFYFGITVETLTGVGAGQLAGARPGESLYIVGGVLISVSRPPGMHGSALSYLSPKKATTANFT